MPSAWSAFFFSAFVRGQESKGGRKNLRREKGEGRVCLPAAMLQNATPHALHLPFSDITAKKRGKRVRKKGGKGREKEKVER